VSYFDGYPERFAHSRGDQVLLAELIFVWREEMGASGQTGNAAQYHPIAHALRMPRSSKVITRSYSCSLQKFGVDFWMARGMDFGRILLSHDPTNTRKRNSR